MSLMLAQMGLATVGGIASYSQARINAGLQEKVREYQNSMRAFSAALSQNTINVNQSGVRDASISQGLSIQQQALRQEGAARVSSAAAGVTGNSSEAIIRDMRSSAGQAQKSRTTALKDQYLMFGQERMNVKLGEVYNRDVHVIPKPSAASALLGLGTDLLNIWDQHQPPGQKTQDRLGNLFGTRGRL